LTFSLSVIWAAILLSPGLAVYAAMFFASGRSPLNPSPPAPTSLVTLGLIIGGALLAHTGAIAGAQLNILLCARGGCPIALPFDPDPYTLIVGLVRQSAPITIGVILFMVGSIAALTIVAYLIVAQLLQLGPIRERVRPLLFGWLAPLARDFERAPGSTLNAFVLTSLREDGLWVGYEGEVDALHFDNDRRLTLIVLVEVRSFVTRLQDTGFARTQSRGRTVIDRLALTSEKIENLALLIFTPPPMPPPA